MSKVGHDPVLITHTGIKARNLDISDLNKSGMLDALRNRHHPLGEAIMRLQWAPSEDFFADWTHGESCISLFENGTSKLSEFAYLNHTSTRLEHVVMCRPNG